MKIKLRKLKKLIILIKFFPLLERTLFHLIIKGLQFVNIL
jgi:hypothetical protein